MLKKLVISLFSICLFVTGCGKEEKVEQENNNKANEIIEEIAFTNTVAENGEIIVILNNNYNKNMDANVQIVFYNKDNSELNSSSVYLIGLTPNYESAIKFQPIDNYNSYKVFIDAIESSHTNIYLNKVTFTESKLEDRISVKISNNSKDLINNITISVIYYDNDKKIIGLEQSNFYDFEAGSNRNVDLYYPYNKESQEIEFSSYKILITEAYSYQVD